MTPLEAEIHRRIAADGPLGVDAFMEAAVGHYYATRDPFGAAGDFTTAPEISQMFGELLGAWAADRWLTLGSPAPFILMEAGPGRGTLMADALRATAKVPEFHKAARIVLLETSPVLKEKQKAALADYDPRWIDSLADFDLPVILLANEFLDALPVRQAAFTDGAWRERAVDVEDNKLCLSSRRRPESLVPPSGGTPAFAGVTGKEGDVLEFSPAREDFVRQTAKLLKSHGGAALFIDYGYEGPATGDTLQAMKAHEFVPVLDHIGEADLTAHVDFGVLKKAAREEGVAVIGPLEQGIFLRTLGIEARAGMLSANATPEQKASVAAAVTRLTAPDQMGRLFRVMELQSG